MATISRTVNLADLLSVLMLAPTANRTDKDGKIIQHFAMIDTNHIPVIIGALHDLMMMMEQSKATIDAIKIASDSPAVLRIIASWEASVGPHMKFPTAAEHKATPDADSPAIQ